MRDMSDLLQFWSEVPPGPPYVHPADAAALAIEGINLEAHGIQTALLPQPWVGPINHARGFVLQLNPGLDGREIGIEMSNVAFRNALQANLCGNEPNVFLNPAFSSHPGRAWVERKLRDVAPLTKIATEIAQLELFPYHSKRFSEIRPARIQRQLLWRKSKLG